MNILRKLHTSRDQSVTLWIHQVFQVKLDLVKLPSLLSTLLIKLSLSRSATDTLCPGSNWAFKFYPKKFSWYKTHLSPDCCPSAGWFIALTMMCRVQHKYKGEFLLTGWQTQREGNKNISEKSSEQKCFRIRKIL